MGKSPVWIIGALIRNRLCKHFCSYQSLSLCWIWKIYESGINQTLIDSFLFRFFFLFLGGGGLWLIFRLMDYWVLFIWLIPVVWYDAQYAQFKNTNCYRLFVTVNCIEGIVETTMKSCIWISLFGEGGGYPGKGNGFVNETDDQILASSWLQIL